MTPEYIICLEDGKKFKSLKRHLRAHYDMSPEEYREKWGLPHDYPMVAPAYAAARSDLAKNMGLGRRSAGAEIAVEAESPVRSRRKPGRVAASNLGKPAKLHETRPYVRPLKKQVAHPAASSYRGLRRTGRRRASSMGDGPDEHYHIRGFGCA